MPLLETYQDLYQRAQQAHHTGEISTAIELYSELVYGLMKKEEFVDEEQQLALIDNSVNRLIELLRWEKRYDDAISLLEQLIEVSLTREPSLRMNAAILRVEAGAHTKHPEEDCGYKSSAGLEELHKIAEADPENIWGWITLGTTYLWLTRYKKAEEHLRQAAELESAEDNERAIAYKYLFDLYDVQGHVEEGLQAWEQAKDLEPTFKHTLPAVLRMLIYWRHFKTAQRYLAQEWVKPRRLFYSGLIAFKNNRMPSAADAWNKVLEYKPEALTEGQDEFAETCLRLLRPSLALEILEPIAEQGMIDRTQSVHSYRLLMLGLAFAQRRVINRAKAALDIALRTADLERPRRTRPAGENGRASRRILDARSRILYGDIRLDPDIRQMLDPYFIPGKG